MFIVHKYTICRTPIYYKLQHQFYEATLKLFFKKSLILWVLKGKAVNVTCQKKKSNTYQVSIKISSLLELWWKVRWPINYIKCFVPVTTYFFLGSFTKNYAHSF